MFLKDGGVVKGHVVLKVFIVYFISEGKGVRRDETDSLVLVICNV